MIKTELTFSADQIPDSQGHLKLCLKGSAATPWRAQWRDLSPPEREIAASRLLYQINPEAAFLQPLTIEGLKNDRQDLVFTCNFKIKDLFGKLSDKTSQTILPLAAPDLPIPYDTLLKNRLQPLAVNDNLVIIDQITLLMAEDSRIIDLPPGGGESLPQLHWRVDCNLDKNKKRLTYTRKLEFRRGMVAADSIDYDNFVNAVRNLKRPEALRIIFSSAKTAAPPSL